MDLFCSNCGNPLREGVKFCNKCGSKVNIEDTSSNKQEADFYSTPQVSDYNKIQNEESKSTNNTFQEQTIQPNSNTSNNIAPQSTSAINNQNNDSQKVENNSLSFGQILKNWWNGKFEGRCSRKEWWQTILHILPFWVISVIVLGLFSIQARFLTFPFDGFVIFLHRYTSFSKDISYFKLPFGVKFTVYIILLLITIKPQISLNTRRLHDLNMSGFWQILFWIPITVYALSCATLYSATIDYSATGFYMIIKNFNSLVAVDNICSFISIVFGLYFAFASGTKGANKYGLPNNSNAQSVSDFVSNSQNTSQEQAYNNNNQNNVSQIPENSSSTFGTALKNWCTEKFNNICSKFESCKNYLEEKNMAYPNACELMNGNIEDCREAIKLFMSVKYFYADSESKIKECEKRIEELEKEEIIKKQKELDESKKDIAPEEKKETEIEFNNVEQKVENKQEAQLETKVDKEIEAKQEIQPKTEVDKEIEAKQEIQPKTEVEKKIKTKQEAQPEIEEDGDDDEEEEIVYGSKDIIVRGSKTRKFFILCFVVFLSIILFTILNLYYYRYIFDNAISEGKYEKLEPLISSSEFIDYATPEQGRKVLEFVIEHNNYDIDKKLALFDYSSFNKFGNIEMGSKIVDSILEIAIKRDNATKFSILAKSKVISYLSNEQFQKLVNSILDNITIDDNNSRYRLLENQIIEPFWDKTQAQDLLKTIVDHTDSNSINEMYDLIDQPCFKRYATEELAESVVASMSKLIKKSHTYEKIQFLTHNYTKQYITSEDRRAIVESFVDSGLPTDNSSLNKLFFEICSQQELENICNKIKKQNIDFPESFLSWAIDCILKNSSAKTKPIKSLIENNDSAKTYIARQAYNELSRHLNGNPNGGYSEIKEIMNTFPWVYSNRDRELMNGWKEAVDTIRQVDNSYGSSGYSTIKQLKEERDRLPSCLPVRGKILGYGGKYKNYFDGKVRECYEVSIDGIYALLYTCETSFATTGYFEINATYLNMNHIPELKGIPVLYEVPYKDACKYDQLSNQISRLEGAASTYNKSKKQTEEAVKSVKVKLYNSFYDIVTREWNEQKKAEEQAELKKIAEESKKFISKNKNKVDKLSKTINIDLVACPAGSFLMGSPSEELGRNSDENQRKVIIRKPFYIGKYEITQNQYQNVMGNNPSHYKRYMGANRPVEMISWENAKSFCERLNQNYSNLLPLGYMFDLPTEEQWEYACRAGTTTALNNGKNLTSIYDVCPNLDEVAWYDKNSSRETRIVGQKKPNAWGIYDMHGNVWEYCRNKKKRGGSFQTQASHCRSANKKTTSSDYFVGFRVALVTNEDLVEQPSDNTKSYVSYINDNSNKTIGIITAKSGINIRKEPKSNSQKVGSIANNAEVTILDTNGPKQTIENISSNWYKVTDGKVSGWCFGGFVNVVDSNDNDYSKTLDNTIPSNRRVSEIPNNITYKKYTNVKYGYSINYPDFMIPNGESDSGDGQKFYFNKETYIAVWASFNMDGIEKEYNSTKETTDSYSVLKKTWFIRSGTDSTNHVYYRKTILDNDYTYTMYFYYPSESKTKFDKIINDVTKSIKVSLFKNAR